MADRPAYIYIGGSPLQHTPMHLNASDMYGFLVSGDLAKLQASIDATLNRVAAGRMQFIVLTPGVVVTFTRVGHAQSSFPADYEKGWGKETDICTWIMVGQRVDGRLQSIFYYPFHIWVDVPMAITIGREIFGYPKNFCQYRMPAPGGDPVRFSLAADGWQPFSPQTELGMHPLLEITATDTAPAHTSLSGFIDLLREILKKLRSMPSLLADVESLLLQERVDQIFLKQFPDGSGLKAVYQAVVTAPATVDKVYSVEILEHTYACRLFKFQSYPLDQTLGLQIGTQPVLAAFHIQFDFTVQAGIELVQAGPA